MTKRSHTGWAAAGSVFLIVGLVVGHFLPSYLLEKLQHPDNSYLSVLLIRHQAKNPETHTVAFYVDFLPAVYTRILLTCFALFATAWALYTFAKRQLFDFWNYPSTALNLAVLRVVILLQLFWFDLSGLPALTHLNYSGMNPVFGYGWLKPFLPPSPSTVSVGSIIFQVLVVLGLLGFLTRYVLPILTFVAFWIMLGPEFVGKMVHYHFVWLGLAILAMSPCADALSIDAWLARKRKIDIHRPSKKYGRAFVFLWMVMGAIYFFPGYWKFVVGGWQWAFSDNVRYKILAKTFELGRPPLIPLYNYPILCQLGGLGTLIFEMTFPLAMIFPWTRRLYAIGGIGFHEINRFVMQIAFTSLEWLYLSFVNWSAVLKLGRLQPAQNESSVKFPLWKTISAWVLVGGLILTGFLGIESWPWSVFPTFAPIEQSFVNSVQMTITQPDGAVQKILLQDAPALIGAYNNNRTLLRAYLNLVLIQQDTTARADMLNGLLNIWKAKNPLDPHAKIEFWSVQVPLWPVGSEPKPFRQIGGVP